MKNKYIFLLLIFFAVVVAGFFVSKSQRIYQKVFITPTPTPVIITEKRVTLIEGWRIEEMAAKLSSELGVRSSEFIKEAKEGYMFPDTYMFDPKATPSEIVAILRANFEKKI